MTVTERRAAGPTACYIRRTYATFTHARDQAERLRAQRAPKVYLPFSCESCTYYHVERRRDLERD